MWQWHSGAGRGMRLRLRERMQGEKLLLRRGPAALGEVPPEAERPLQSEPRSLLQPDVRLRLAHHSLHAQQRVPRQRHVHRQARLLPPQLVGLFQAWPHALQLGHPGALNWGLRDGDVVFFIFFILKLFLLVIKLRE